MFNNSVKPMHSRSRRYLANRAQGRRNEKRLALLLTSSGIRRVRDKKFKCAQVSTSRATIKRFGIWDGDISGAKGASIHYDGGSVTVSTRVQQTVEGQRRGVKIRMIGHARGNVSHCYLLSHLLCFPLRIDM